MKLEIPVELGSLKDSDLSNKTTIIFASDNHASYLAQKNIALLYLHLAREYGLNLVSFENYTEPFFLPSRSASFTEEAVARDIRKRQFKLENGELLLDHRQIIVVAAAKLGHRLSIAPGIKEPAFEKLRIACYKYMHIHEMASKEGLSEAEIAALGADYLDEFIRLDAGVTREYVPDGVINEDTPLSEVMRITSEALDRVRTQDQLEILRGYLLARGDQVALMIMGGGHSLDFVEEAKKARIGYGIFVPNGRDVIDTTMMKNYSEWLGGVKVNLNQFES